MEAVAIEWIGILVLAAWVGLIAAGLPGLLGMTRLRRLPVPDAPAAGWPFVSIILAARNEQETIEASVRTLLALDYPALELILVDDRSDDGTVAILRGLAAEDPRVQVVELRCVPEGWVGKNNALMRGAERAQGEWLLLTDADVHLYDGAVKVCVAHAVRAGLGHLTLAPTVRSSSYLLGGLVSMFTYSLMLFRMPQYAKWRRLPPFMGLGAFNLVRADVYRAIGTHAALRNRPDDDLQLGRLVKRMGFRQDFAIGFDLAEVEWYPNLGAMMRGIEKNCLTTFEYSATGFVLGVLFILVFDLLPAAGALFARGWPQIASIAVGLVAFAHFLIVGRGSWRTVSYFVLWPVFVLLFAVTVIRANTLAHLRGGLIWRDTLYPFSVLREKAGGSG